MSSETHIEAEFQERVITAAAFTFLSAAYDTVWKHGSPLHTQPSDPVPEDDPANREHARKQNFQCNNRQQDRQKRTLNDGLLQSSVLSPLFQFIPGGHA